MTSGKTAEVPAADDTGTKKSGEAESGPNSGTDDKKAGARERGEDGKFAKKSDAGDEKGGDEDPDKELPQGVKKRIGKEVRARREAEERAARLERELEEARKGKTSEQPKKDEKPKAEAAEPKKPKPEDFASYEEYIDALTDYKADARERAREAKEAERKQAEANETHKKQWEKKVEATREKYGDYDEVMEDAGDTPISRAMHNAIAESDIGPELAYYLATHLDEAKDLAKLSPTAAIKAMARIEDKLTEASSDQKPPAETKDKTAKKELPKPPRNVGGTATPRERKLDDPDISFEEFRRLASANLKRR